MSQEKSQAQKLRKVAANKGVTKKSAEMPRVEQPLVPLIVPVMAATPGTLEASNPQASNSQPSKAKPKAKPRTKAKSLQVTIEDIIRLRAYEIYLERGATPGNPHEDWDVAEREVRAHFGHQAEA
jgi:Protein of unknown function (DUF2934)